MNYFEFFELPIGLSIDKNQLKKQFIRNSKKYHPDFFTLESNEEQDRVLELSTKNNEGYKVLSNFDSRFKYVLELKGLIQEEKGNAIPQDFLMEMMDVNEALMELEFDFDAATYKKVVSQIEGIEADLIKDINPYIESFDFENAEDEIWTTLKNNYFKRKYIWRLKEKVSIFAPH